MWTNLEKAAQAARILPSDLLISLMMCDTDSNSAALAVYRVLASRRIPGTLRRQ
jgi:hypothetical protein